MSEQSNSTICQQIAPADLAAFAGQAVLLDVRSPIEFETEHIANSINLPLNELEARFEEVPRQGQLVVICRSGKRAERGAFTLLGRGFQPKVLEGGLVAWRQAGLPVKEGKKMLPIERQIQLIVGVGVLTGLLLGVFINPWFLVIPGFFGAGLTLAGLSGTCALGLLLMKTPWNQLPGVSTAMSCGDTNSKSKGSCNPARFPLSRFTCTRAIMPAIIRALSAEGVCLLDVRTKGEYDRGHIEGSLHIPLPELRNRLAEIPADKDIVTYCQSGQRSYIASRLLKQKGFRVKNLSGSYLTWSSMRA